MIHIYKIKKCPSGSLPKVDIQTSRKVIVIKTQTVYIISTKPISTTLIVT